MKKKAVTLLIPWIQFMEHEETEFAFIFPQRHESAARDFFATHICYFCKQDERREESRAAEGKETCPGRDSKTGRRRGGLHDKRKIRNEVL